MKSKLINRLGITGRIDVLWLIMYFSLSMFPILPNGVRSVSLILMFTFSVIINKGFKKDKILIFLSTPFLIYFFTCIFNSDFLLAIDRLVILLPLAIIPISYIKFERATAQKVLRVSNLLFVFAVVVMIIAESISIINNQELLNATISLTDYIIMIRKIATATFDSHPTYQGLFIVFSLIILSSEFIHNVSRNIRVALALLMIILSLFLFVISARIAIVALFMMLIILFIKMRNVKLKLFILAAVSLTLFISKPLKARLIDFKVSNLTIPNDNDISSNNSISTRYAIWTCDIEIIKNNINGIGLANEKRVLNECLNSFNVSFLNDKHYNSHNQYLSYMISGGIIALLLFLFYLIIILYYSKKHNSMELFLFVVVVTIFLMTENIFYRNDGVLAYSLILSNLFFSIKKDKSLKLN